MSPAAPTSPETRLGIYRIVSLLGRGGMGEVYLAWDELLERHVAIKQVRTDRIGGATQQARFLREARAIARLDHPAIIRVYHVLERDDSYYLVMEYVRGQDLTQWTQERRVTVAQAAALGRDVASGLAAAHDQGLVHRDLKPANVMVVHDANASGQIAPGRTKILDFGLAKAFRPDAPNAEDEELTQTGMIVGTAHAMSPEQAAGRPLDHRSDLFALGSLLYELLSGRAPFRGDNLVDSLRRVMTVEPEPIARLVPNLHADFAAVVNALLVKDPEGRPVNAHLVADRLGKIAASLDDKTHVLPAGRTAATADPDLPTAELPNADLPTAELPTSALPHHLAPMPAPTGSGLSSAAIRVLVVTDLVDSTKLLGTLGDARMAEISTRHDRMARDLLARYNGLEIDKTDGFLLLFERPGDAVNYALSYHQALQRLSRNEGVELTARAGIHLGEVLLRRNPESDVARGAKPLEVEGLAKPTAARLMSLAGARQTLLTRGVFDLARRAAVAGDLADPELRWLAHGAYSFQGIDEELEVCEVGVRDFAPLAEPKDSEKAKRAVAFSQEMVLGWRPAAGQAIPRRPNWELVRRLGEGGFGEVWLARHKSDEERVFKFCFEADKLRTLKREVTLFRLLRETLGQRRDIARVLDWDFEEAPFFLESEYTDGGDLVHWAEHQGGLTAVPLPTRLALVAGAAEALAAAHSVGILHKDVKPSNVLVAHDDDGRPQARLADFGIGLLTERGKLNAPGFTVLGFTQTALDDGSSTSGGTVQYMAPEMLTGKPATIQADVYSLGILLYQAVVGDFERPLAPGWRRDIDDDLLVEDVAACVDGNPEHRLRGAADLAERLRSLDERRTRRRAVEEAEKAEKRAVRRRRLASTLGAAAAVLLLVISVFAYQTLQAKNRELEARQNAEQRRQQAEALINFMLGDMRQELESIGKLDVLDRVGDQAMEYFASVPDGDLSDEETRSYAKALHQIGQVRFNLGKIPEAAEAFGESLEMAKRLAARDPENTDWQFELGQSHFWLGYLRWQEGDFDGALDQFEGYRRISEALVEQDPENTTWQIELAYSHSNIGSVLEEQGHLVEAAYALEASARIFEGLSLRQPDDLHLAVELAHVYAKLGRILEGRGSLAQARSRFEASLAIYTRAAEAQPDNMELALFVNNALNFVGHIFMMQGETSTALEYFRSSLEHSKRLVTHDPKHQVWLTEYIQDVNIVARTLMTLGKLDEALPLLTEDRETTRQLLAKAPDHSKYRLAYARNLWSWSQADIRQARPQEAIDKLTDALKTLENLTLESDLPDYDLWLTRVYETRGEVYQATGDTKRAAESWARGVEIAERLVNDVPTPENLEAAARILTLAGRATQAEPLIKRLNAMPYNKVTYQEFLKRNNLP